MKMPVRHRNGVTIVEIVFVIVILGIVSSIGAQIIAQTYKSYVVQRAQYHANIKTELTLSQIANRLRYAIPGTVGYRQTKSMAFHFITEADGSDQNVLQWVGYDGDSFEAIDSGSGSAARRPGWSGFVDIDAYVSGSTTLPTPGSHMDLTKSIINNLGGSIDDARILFPDGKAYGIADSSGENITLDSALPSNTTLYERYKLAWTSYALVIEGEDLYLYYDFTPDVGVSIPSDAKKSLLLKKITNFRFKGSEGSMRIKICKKEMIDTNASIHSCKEKVIF